MSDFDYQAAEVRWYHANGAHPSRVKSDHAGRPYVLSDASWNRRATTGNAENIERLMRTAVDRQQARFEDGEDQ